MNIDEITGDGLGQAEDKKIDDGGPAFPVVIPFQMKVAEAGMSLRDHFASTVNVEGIEFGEMDEAAEWIGHPVPSANDFIACLEFTFHLEAFIRFKKADAMIAARKGGEA